MSVQCKLCDAGIDVIPKMPLRVVTENGKQVVPTDYSAVYEHMRDEHPDQWTEELAASYERHKQS